MDEKDDAFRQRQVLRKELEDNGQHSTSGRDRDECAYDVEAHRQTDEAVQE